MNTGKVIKHSPGAACSHLISPYTQTNSSPHFSSFFSVNSETVEPFGVLKYYILFLTVHNILQSMQDMPNAENHSSRTCF